VNGKRRAPSHIAPGPHGGVQQVCCFVFQLMSDTNITESTSTVTSEFEWRSDFCSWKWIYSVSKKLTVQTYTVLYQIVSQHLMLHFCYCLTEVLFSYVLSTVKQLNSASNARNISVKLLCPYQSAYLHNNKDKTAQCSKCTNVNDDCHALSAAVPHTTPCYLSPGDFC